MGGQTGLEGEGLEGEGGEEKQPRERLPPSSPPAVQTPHPAGKQLSQALAHAPHRTGQGQDRQTVASDGPGGGRQAGLEREGPCPEGRGVCCRGGRRRGPQAPGAALGGVHRCCRVSWTRWRGTVDAPWGDGGGAAAAAGHCEPGGSLRGLEFLSVTSQVAVGDAALVARVEEALCT